MKKIKEEFIRAAKLFFSPITGLYTKITREIRYRKRIKELKKKDPFIYK